MLWSFYALGPQVVVCLLLGWITARRSQGDLVDWLAIAFVASLVPLAGPVVMLALWWGWPRRVQRERGRE